MKESEGYKFVCLMGAVIVAFCHDRNGNPLPPRFGDAAFAALAESIGVPGRNFTENVRNVNQWGKSHTEEERRYQWFKALQQMHAAVDEVRNEVP